MAPAQSRSGERISLPRQLQKDTQTIIYMFYDVSFPELVKVVALARFKNKSDKITVLKKNLLMKNLKSFLKVCHSGRGLLILLRVTLNHHHFSKL